MKSQVMPILLNFIAAFIGALGQYFYKMGAKKINPPVSYFNLEILVGMILFIAVMVLFIVAFKLGGNLSVTYPVYSLTFLVGIFLGVFLDKEPWHYMQLVGAFVIIFGIMLVVSFAPTNNV